MRVMVASDIHGAAPACKALLAAFAQEGASRLFLLGDLLYHGPRNPLPEGYDPAETARLLNEYAADILCVRGNCDAEVDQMLLSFPILAEFAAWQGENAGAFLAHGHQFSAENPAPARQGEIYLSGHTHVPRLALQNNVLLANPGSVGLPKEGSVASYLLFDGGNAWLKNLAGDILEQFSLSLLKNNL